VILPAFIAAADLLAWLAGRLAHLPPSRWHAPVGDRRTRAQKIGSWGLE
jgi:hypothetical protein